MSEIADQALRTRIKAEVAGANWATTHSEFHDYTDLRTEARIEAESRYGEGDETSEADGFVLGAMSVRKECCVRKGF